MTAINLSNTKIVPAETTLAPFYDDFSESKSFLRILFRPGYAVQGRELTQLQTILQNQIERFGNHIFQNGSIVLGGEMTLGQATYINLQNQYNGIDVVASKFAGNTITYSTGNVKVQAVVVGTREVANTDPPVLVVQYLTGDEFGNNSTIVSNSNVFANISSSNAYTGAATTASIGDGIFFMNGYFIKVPAQTIVVDKYSASANAKIGLEFSNEIVDSSADSSLLDPALEASNYQAPGASRLRINFNLATRSLTSADDSSFVEFIRVQNGVITKKTNISEYAALGDTLARRTYDQAGNYTVDPFIMNILDHPTDDTKLRAYFDPGKAYVQGYEFSSLGQDYLDIPRARANSSINNYGIPINYGNYMIVDNMAGVMDYTVGSVVDIHCVPFTTANLFSNIVYTSTKIGTAKVRNIYFVGGSNTTNANTRTYAVSLFDTAFANITSNVVTSSSNGIVIFNPTGTFSLANGAYNGATIRVTSNTGAGQSWTISNWSYFGPNANVFFANTTTAIGTALDNTSTISIDFDVTLAESLIISAFTAGAPSARANANVDVANKVGNAANGAASLTDITLNSLVFPFPQSFIKAGGVLDQTYTYWKKFTTTFAAGSAVISVTPPNEAFNSAGGSGTSTDVLSNFIVIRNDNNLVAPISVVAVNAGAGTATFTASDATLGATCTIFARVTISAGANINPKQKVLTTGNTTLFSSSTSNGSFISAIGTNTTLYLTSGQATVQSPSRTPSDFMSLYTADIKKISAIYDLNGAALPAAGGSLIGYSDVTNLYDLDTGQKDSHYDHGGIKLKQRVASPSGPLIVCYDWYDHIQGSTSDGLGYFDVDSYPNVANTAGYAAIPSYTTSTGAVLSLRDSLDFRPRRQNASNTGPNWTVQGFRVPSTGLTFRSDYQYYMPRRDYIILSTDFTDPFKLIQGEPGLYPQNPKSIDGTMILYKIYLEPYTMSSMNATSQYVENKRYTMRDIGKLETRIENLEYYQTLSMLEKSATTLSVKDAYGLDRTKYGIMVDDFSTSGIGDTNNPDYNAAIDKVYGSLVPSQNVVRAKLITTALTNTKKSGTIATLSYTEEVAVSQTAATKWATIQPYQFAQFIGTIFMDPPSDNWVDTMQAPDVIVNVDGVNNSLLANNLINTARSNVRNNAFTTTQNWYKLFFGSITV